MGFGLFNITSGGQPLGTTATGRGGQIFSTVEEAKSSYAPQGRFVDRETGFYGTADEIYDRAKSSGMGAMQLQALKQSLANRS